MKSFDNIAKIIQAGLLNLESENKKVMVKLLNDFRTKKDFSVSTESLDIFTRENLMSDGSLELQLRVRRLKRMACKWQSRFQIEF